MTPRTNCFDATAQPVLIEVPSVVGKTVQFAAGVLSTIGSSAVVERIGRIRWDPRNSCRAGTRSRHFGDPRIARGDPRAGCGSRGFGVRVWTRSADGLDEADDNEAPVSNYRFIFNHRSTLNHCGPYHHSVFHHDDRRGERVIHDDPQSTTVDDVGHGHGSHHDDGCLCRSSLGHPHGDLRLGRRTVIGFASCSRY
ncbi:MAG: hypothetical protein CM1200mP26_24080 [Acidimicrobiales bacterium]|nr:MAG: hypothetical protein CM1200mP26_24080 [Acidimicrobiales bacterium]